MPPERKGSGDALMNRNFVLLLLLSTSSFCYLSVYYCFEQWLVGVGVDHGWRGILLGALFGMVMVARPAVSVAVLRMRTRPVLAVSLLVNTCVLLSYQFLPAASPLFPWLVLGLRLAQGFFLAVYSACTVSLLVVSIPPDQSARGFALFSLTHLVPNALVPSVGEFLLPILGGEPRLYAATALLGVPALLMIRMLGPEVDRPQSAPERDGGFLEAARRMAAGVSGSGLGWIYLTMVGFTMTAHSCLFFMKGLCSVTGEAPGRFFLCYALTMILVRVAFSRSMDRLPKFPMVPLAALVMTASVQILAWGPSWSFEPGAVVYGMALSVIYPLTASTIYERARPEVRAVASNLLVFTGDASSLVSPLLVGGAMSMGLGYRGVFSFAACFGLLCGGAYAADWLLRRRKARAR